MTTPQQRGRTNKARGSAFERECAAIFGLKRTPLSGASGGGDLTAPAGSLWGDFSWECKRMKKLPVKFANAIRQAELDVGIGGTRIPAVLTREDHGTVYMIVPAEKLRAWVEAVAEVGGGAHIKALLRDLDRIARELKEAV